MLPEIFHEPSDRIIAQTTHKQIAHNVNSKMFLDAPITISHERSKLAWETMTDTCQRFYDSSTLVPKTSQESGHLCWSDVQIERLLGVGTFSDVYQVTVDNPCFECPSYALKCVSWTRFRKFDEEYISIAADLALESAILSSLQHNNIITVYGGNSSTDPDSMRGPFLVMDRLEETLADRLDRLRGLRNPFSTNMSARSILKRLQSCIFGICDAMNYLHKNNIVLRDLKPANVGFDYEGTVKLFDFGLARNFKDCRHSTSAGSLRYMAPETIMGQGNNPRSDVYSFGVLLYETVTLIRPYNHLRRNKKRFIDKVVYERYRPCFRRVLPSRTLARLISACWDHDPDNRPPFSCIITKLEKIGHEISSTGQQNGISYTSELEMILQKTLISRQLQRTETTPIDFASPDDAEDDEYSELPKRSPNTSSSRSFRWQHRRDGRFLRRESSASTRSSRSLVSAFQNKRR